MTSPTPQGSAFLDFFVLEAGEYVEQIDGLLARASGSGPDADSLQKVSRALRGTATMARLTSFAELASTIEAVGRALRQGALRWDDAIKGALVAAVDDLKLLVRAARAWSTSEDEWALKRIAELSQFVQPQAAPGPPPSAQVASSFFVNECNNVAAGLELLATRPQDRAAAIHILTRVRALRGVAGVKEVPALAEVSEAAESAIRPLEVGQAQLSQEQLGLLRAAADVLRAIAGALGRGERVTTDTPEYRAYMTALDSMLAHERSADRVVPIAKLFYDDAGPHIVEKATDPPMTPGQRFRMEVVSLGEHLHGVIDEARRADDDIQREHARGELGRALRAIRATAASFEQLAVAQTVEGYLEKTGDLTAEALDAISRFAETISPAPRTRPAADPNSVPIRMSQVRSAVGALGQAPPPPPHSAAGPACPGVRGGRVAGERAGRCRAIAAAAAAARWGSLGAGRRDRVVRFARGRALRGAGARRGRSRPGGRPALSRARRAGARHRAARLAARDRRTARPRRARGDLRSARPRPRARAKLLTPANMKISWRGAIGLALTAFLLWWVFRGLHWADIARELRGANVPLVLLAVFTGTMMFPLRAQRWRPILSPVAPGIGFGPVWRATAIGMMANNILPARAGELVRAFVLTREAPVSFSAAFASLVVDRVFDAFIVIMLMVAAMFDPAFPSGSLVAGRPASAYAIPGMLALAAIAAALYAIVFFPNQLIRLYELLARRVAPRFEERGRVMLRAFADGLSVLRHPGRFTIVFAWALAHWLVQALAFWIMFRALDIDAPFSAALFVQGLIVIGVALPSTPGFFGLFEAAAKAGLVLYGVSESLAVTWGFTYHVLSLIPITLIGLYYVARTGMKLGELKDIQR